MSIRSEPMSEPEPRSVLGPAGNKSRSSFAKPTSNKSDVDITTTNTEQNKKRILKKVPSVLRRQESLNASCSSDVSTDSLQSRGSTGRLFTRSNSTSTRRKQCVSRSVTDSDSVSSLDMSLYSKKRCPWVTPNTEPCYAAFHDEEWGVPVHDDKKLFELLVFSGALAEQTWPTILMKRHIFREVFADFDPVAVSKFNEKKILAPGSTANSLLSDVKLRAIIENARQIVKIVDEFGSFDKYIWSFVNYKPIVNKFRYARQVPAKTSKADVMSKDLLRRGFRSVSATIIYSFMQVTGLTNDHLITCFRFQECINPVGQNEEDGSKMKVEERRSKEMLDLGLARAMDDFSFSSE
ncbi:hypothetical protein IFM89_019579 [Coptis chinensis]|uniref:DNA-3-methyladenine glycosylase I n=1 Tax=Coptis chinensis TaxID=261450 RepID=A0A835M324_9MAGN|nr:hypothetical protein IFM89_019579 [Coptis chinensis]